MFFILKGNEMAAKHGAASTDHEQTKSKHPPYSVMVEEALIAMNSRQGTTRQAVTKHLAEKYHLNAANCTSHANKALKACLEKNVIESSTGDLKGKLKISKDRKEELKKTAKKGEKKTDKILTEEPRKAAAATKPPKQPVEKKSKEAMEEKENLARAERTVSEGSKGEEKEEGVKAKKRKAPTADSRKLKKSASTSKIDEIKEDVKARPKMRGSKKDSESQDVEEYNEATKKTKAKKGAKRKQ